MTYAESYKLLSLRESSIFEKIIEGKNNKEIANELHISVHTVKNHITNIGEKLGKKGRGELRRWISEL